MLTEISLFYLSNREKIFEISSKSDQQCAENNKLCCTLCVFSTKGASVGVKMTLIMAQ